MAGRRRDLSEEERALWKRVASTARPIGRGGEPPAEGAPAAGEPPTEPAPRPVARQRPEPRREMPLTGLDRRTEQRLKRGALEVEARVDLHGMTQAAAHAALRRFLAGAQAKGLRLILVITGKGGAEDERDFTGDPRGVLRRQVPHWLQGPEMRPLVSGFTQAHHRHGGAGALYVRVRRAR